MANIAMASAVSQTAKTSTLTNVYATPTTNVPATTQGETKSVISIPMALSLQMDNPVAASTTNNFLVSNSSRARVRFFLFEIIAK